MSNPLRLLIPQPCPVPLVRIGGTGDGAYLVPDDLAGILACFSPGVNNSKDFEDDLANRFGICSHLCDYTSDTDRFKTPLIAGKQTFEKKWLEPVSGEDATSLEDWINRYAPNPADDLILQMDIEGAEYRNLLAASVPVLTRFRVIAIELHGLLALIQSPTDNPVARLLVKLDATHVCVHAHPNNCCGEFIDPVSGMNIPNVIELAYLRRDRLPSPATKYFQPQLPHPNDIAYNVRDRPPLHLNDRWVYPAQRTEASTIKMLGDNEDYLRHTIAVIKETERSREASRANADHLAGLAIRNLYAAMGCDAPALRRRTVEQGSIDLALGRPFLLSSSVDGSPRTGIVSQAGTYFSQTAVGYNQSITIEFDRIVPLGSLAISSRNDANQEPVKRLFWVVHDDLNVDLSLAYPVSFGDDVLVNSDGASWTPLLRKLGRFLTVFCPEFAAVQFSRLSVYGAE